MAVRRASCVGLALVLIAACSDESGDHVTAPTTPAYTPRFEHATCTDDVVKDPRVECGVLTVPADRSQPNAGDVRLPVAIVRAAGGARAEDPVVYLEGGPGYPGTLTAALFLEHGFPGRDVITFDQRGTGRASPSLDCPETTEVIVANFGAADPPSAEADREDAALLACRARLRKSGVDLADYNTATSAADVADLRIALHVDRWDLFGVSYGTALALEVLRRHPEGVRAAVLDSVRPPHIKNLSGVSLARRLERVLDLASRSCAADAACNAAFPDVRGSFEALIEKYEADPFRGEITSPVDGMRIPIAVTGQDIVGGAFSAFYDSSLIPLLPLFTRQLLDGNTSVIPPLAENGLADQVGVADAMEASVTCSDEAALDITDELDDVRAINPLYEEFAGREGAICRRWGVSTPRSGFNTPVSSPVRALVLAGEFDPVHPPSWSRSAAVHLGNADFVEIPGVGHAVVFSNDCGRSIAEAFVDDPDAAPDTSCIAKQGPPKWATS